ncbi:chromate efflux transporter [Sphaerotilus sp.]|uniref:chromate efflux transporter n=1 Tax=Sphaerotilus sp. TaxID=2093942 RepID=UPI002ACD24BC|nr:chromate efflux transporter [Sphaerotilus sp.]MDZ7858211.1 chromate efflux transporter [Sphaerotilus sp.]
MPPSPDRPAPPTFREAFFYWLQLGCISFGGPAGQIALMHAELVDKRRWISEQRFLHALNYCMVLPGPEAQQLAIYLGWLLHRTWGGIVAGTLFVLPSLFLLAALTWVYLVFGDVPAVKGIFEGIKPAVVAIVVFAAWRIGARALKNRVLQAMAVLSFVALFGFGVPFPAIVLAAGLIGWVGGRIAPQYFQTGGGGQGAAKPRHGPALIDDDTPAPPHARFRWGYLLLLLGVALGLWVGMVALLLGQPVLHDMGIFFTKAALLTFGGAYAVLPYVYQGGVETHGWLTGPQMMDGLALGESTPGPLIMVVAFVGFVGAWTKEVFGPEALAVAGLAGAAVATFFTFLPSFVFILAGAPLVESTRGNLKFTAPLTGITAAVVGVILNLAVFFGWHVVWPRATAEAPFSGGIAVFSAALAVGAFVALWRYRQDVMTVLAVCAGVGLLRSLV